MQPVPNRRMKRLRENLALTQGEVAEKLGMPLSSYAMIEAGYRLNPRRDVQKRIANFYDCTIDELFLTIMITKRELSKSSHLRFQKV